MQLDSCDSRSSILGPAAATCTCILSGPMYSAPEVWAASARTAHSHTLTPPSAEMLTCPQASCHAW